jgi:uncharacterized membrane protein YccC
MSVAGSPSGWRSPSLSRLVGDSVSVRQAIKTGIAGVATAYLADALKLPQGFWAVITAIIVATQSNLGTAITASWNQLAGAAIGATVGAASAAIWGTGILVFGTAVTIAVLLSTGLGLRNSYPMAGFNVAIVMIVPHLDTLWTFALHRFLEVALGGVVALVVTTVVWPSRAHEHARRGIAEALTRLNVLFQEVTQPHGKASLAPVQEAQVQVNEALRRNDESLGQVAAEPIANPACRASLAVLQGHLHRLSQSLGALPLRSQERERDTYFVQLEPELSRLIAAISGAFTHLAKGIAARRFDCQSPDLDGAHCALQKKAVAMREAGVPSHYSFEEVLRTYAFLLSLKGVVEELRLTRLTARQLFPG